MPRAQVGQGPLRTRGPELLSVSEERIILLRRLWLREVNALIDGKPLTDWKIPAEPFVAAGKEQPAKPSPAAMSG